MCGRYRISEMTYERRIQKIMGSLYRIEGNFKTGDICPGDKALVIANNRRMEKQVFAMGWGYHLTDGKLVFNTRSETASTRPMFAEGIAQHRCLIPAEVYYEWETLEKGKQKYEIGPMEAVKQEDGFFLAGIYRLEGRNPVFSIMTQTPKEEIAFIHQRMPVIIPDDRALEWLDPKADGEAIIRSIRLNELSYLKCS